MVTRSKPSSIGVYIPRAWNVLKHRSIEDGYCAAVEEINQKRAELYQPDDDEVIRRIKTNE